MRRMWIFSIVAIALFLFLGADAYIQNGSVVVRPQIASAQYYYQTIEKRCGNCGKVVPNSSQVGDRCPHCGCIWGMQQTEYVDGGYATPYEDTSVEPEEENITITVMTDGEEGEEESSEFEIVFQDQDDTVMVPLRDFVEGLGATIEWSLPDTLTIYFDDSDATITITVDETLVVINWGWLTREVELSVAPVMHSDITYVSLIDIAELMSYTVELSEDDSEATLTPIVPSDEAVAAAKEFDPSFLSWFEF